MELAAAKRVDFHRRALAGTHVLQLRLLKVRGDPYVVDLHEREERLARLHDLPDVDPLLRDDAGRGRLDDGVLQVELRLRERRARLLRVRVGGGRPRFGHRDLLRCGLRGLQFGVCLLFAGAGLHQPALGDANAGFGFDHLRPRRVGGRLRAIRRGDRAVELLLRDLVLREQAAKPLDVARRLDSVGLRFADAGLRRHHSRSCGLDLFLGGGGRGLRLRDAAAGGGHAARRGRRGDRHVAACSDRVGFGIGELRLGFFHGDLVVARVELDQHRAGLDPLVVVHGDLRDRAADARRNLGDPRVDLRIVGRLAAGGQPQPRAHPDDGHDDSGDRESDLLAAQRGPPSN